VTRGTRTTESIARVTDEARLGFNRMVRDTREGREIASVAADLNTYRVLVDFNADGDTLDELEDLEYSYNPGSEQIRLNGELLMSGVSCVPDAAYTSGCRPVFDFRSDRLEYDWHGLTSTTSPPDGVVTWQELDEAPTHGVIGVGNGNGSLDAEELPYITSIVFSVRVVKNDASQDFQAIAQLRNNR